MDTSKEYINMCRKAVEIQKLFKAEKGDFYFCFCTDIEPTDMFPKGYGLSIITEWDADLNSELLIRSGTDIWLPRQDQLQEMIETQLSVKSNANHIAIHFAQFVNNHLENVVYWELELKSMEQLWLAFVMWEKFNKKWNKDWSNWM